MCHRTVGIVFAGVALWLLPSCNGILGGIYDEPETDSGFGFVNVDESSSSGTVYIDASSYSKWTYIDLKNRTIDTTVVKTGGEEEGIVPDSWHFAVHRYDTKTNGGMVMETSFSSFDGLLASGKLPSGEFVQDIWTEDRIAVDMSGMMEGKIVYAPSFFNPELSQWLNVDTSTMPPIYSMPEKVYILKNSDGSHAAIKLVNYMNDSKVKGFMTIDYIYPLEF